MTKHDEHFHMSDEYENNSSSQKSVGRRVIQTAIELAKITLDNPQKIKCLDIACGPGNLTIEFLHLLENNFPGIQIDLAGLDYSEINVKRLVSNSRGMIRGIVGSFYKIPKEVQGQNIIISNEGLHWQPPYKMNQLNYEYMRPERKEKYETWALQNLKNALRNIYDTMQDNAIAVLQFGHEGQLKNIWGLIYEIFHETAFKKYISKINFPVYQPSVENILFALKKAGFAEQHIEINAYTEDLNEDTPLSITKFFKAVSQAGFSQHMTPDVLVAFYKRMEDKLQDMNLKEFRDNQWHRTLIKLIKATH